jgi:hypothetical protein
MDEKIEKAFDVANYMATLSNQRRLILEQYDQSLLYYTNGATFKIDHSLISFVKTLINLGSNSNVVLVDSNKFPTVVDDLTIFLNIVEQYLSATQKYADQFNEIKSKRKIIDIVEL